MSNSQEYNGWSNYATWRVHLEMFDGMDPNDMFPGLSGRVDLGDALKYYARECIEETSSGVARDWALAFLSDVNFDQIARHMLEAYPAQEQEDA
jgi:hypothetical protein